MPAMTSASARDVARAEDFEKDPAVVVTSAAGAGVYVVGALEGDGLNTLIGTLSPRHAGLLQRLGEALAVAAVVPTCKAIGGSEVSRGAAVGRDGL